MALNAKMPSLVEDDDGWTYTFGIGGWTSPPIRLASATKDAAESEAHAQVSGLWRVLVEQDQAWHESAEAFAQAVAPMIDAKTARRGTWWQRHHHP